MNQAIFFFFYNLAHKSVVFDKIIVFLAVYFPYVVIILAGIFLLMHHEVFKNGSTLTIFLEKRKEIMKAFLVGITAWILAYVLKLFFHMPRPFDALSQIYTLIPETGYTFPSSHATFFMALAFSIFFFHKKKAGLPAQAGYVFMFFALLIGVARIVAGVHFPIDILGGFILGALVAFTYRSF